MRQDAEGAEGTWLRFISVVGTSGLVFTVEFASWLLSGLIQ